MKKAVHICLKHCCPYLLSFMNDSNVTCSEFDKFDLVTSNSYYVCMSIPLCDKEITGILEKHWGGGDFSPPTPPHPPISRERPHHVMHNKRLIITPSYKIIALLKTFSREIRAMYLYKFHRYFIARITTQAFAQYCRSCFLRY